MREKTKTERERDAAFIAKIKSITIGGKKIQAPSCPDCGAEMKLAGIGIMMKIKRPDWSRN